MLICNCSHQKASYYNKCKTGINRGFVLLESSQKAGNWNTTEPQSNGNRKENQDTLDHKVLKSPRWGQWREQMGSPMGEAHVCDTLMKPVLKYKHTSISPFLQWMERGKTWDTEKFPNLTHFISMMPRLVRLKTKLRNSLLEGWDSGAKAETK